jgi:4-hydroxy-tetrahydrodipicolinate synthase
MLERFPGFEIFPGSETFLLDALRLGGVGCISATANINVRAMRELVDAWQSSEADAMQQRLSALRAAVQKFPMVAANKAILARMQGAANWAVVRPPLVALAKDATAQLFAAVEAQGFELEPSATLA